MSLAAIIRNALHRRQTKTAQQEFKLRSDNAVANPWSIGTVTYSKADRGFISDRDSGDTDVVDTRNNRNNTHADVYSVRPSESVSQGPVGGISVDMHDYSPAYSPDLQEAAGVANYYTRLMNNPRFIGYLGGVDKAKGIAARLSSTPMHRETKGDVGGYYNPLTGGIGIDGNFSAPIAVHELGHRLYYASPEYRARIYAAMRRHNIPYSALYLSPKFFNTASSGPYYLDQPTEQAAELQRVRSVTSAYPGAGSGENGDFTHDDYLKLQPYFDRSRYFSDKPEAYILDLLNTARFRRNGLSGAMQNRVVS